MPWSHATIIDKNQDHSKLFFCKMLKRQLVSCLGWIIAAVFVIMYRENRSFLKQNDFSEHQTCEQSPLIYGNKKVRILIGFEEFLKPNSFAESWGRVHTRHYYSKLKSGIEDLKIDVKYFIDKDLAIRSVFGDSMKVNLHRK